MLDQSALLSVFIILFGVLTGKGTNLFIVTNSELLDMDETQEWRREYPQGAREHRQWVDRISGALGFSGPASTEEREQAENGEERSVCSRAICVATAASGFVVSTVIGLSDVDDRAASASVTARTRTTACAGVSSGARLATFAACARSAFAHTSASSTFASVPCGSTFTPIAASATGARV
jgi:hypothetical protein